MIDHDLWSMEGISRVFDGDDPGDFGLSRDDVLDNITLYWLTNTGVSSGRIYRENKLGFFDAKGVSVPVAVSVSLTTSVRLRGVGWSRPIPS
jgi:hypothetical protein